MNGHLLCLPFCEEGKAGGGRVQGRAWQVLGRPGQSRASTSGERSCRLCIPVYTLTSLCHRPARDDGFPCQNSSLY